jgi:hypothetical protein
MLSQRSNTTTGNLVFGAHPISRAKSTILNRRSRVSL